MTEKYIDGLILIICLINKLLTNFWQIILIPISRYLLLLPLFSIVRTCQSDLPTNAMSILCVRQLTGDLFDEDRFCQNDNVMTASQARSWPNSASNQNGLCNDPHHK